jgi:hypothetical protein
LWPLKISSGPLLGINNDWSLISSNKIKFYSRYVDDILVLIRPSDIPTVLQKFNYFHPQIQFSFTHEELTVTTFTSMRYSCPEYQASYIGKPDRCLMTRLISN